MKINLFQGRVSRTVYFLSTISLNILISVLIQFGRSGIASVSSELFLLIFLLWLGLVAFVIFLWFAQIGLHIKRWHDLGKSGWFVIFSLLPLIGFFVIVALFFIPGDPKKNKYGEKPQSIRF